MMVNVRNGGEVSNTFAITNGVKQGRVLAPTLFSIFLSAMFVDAFRELRDEIYIQSRQNADLLTVAHFRAKTKTTNILVTELFFCRRQRTNCAPSKGDPENCCCVCQCITKVWPQYQHKKDSSDVPTDLYNYLGGVH